MEHIKKIWDEMTPLIEESYREIYGESPDEPTLADTTLEMLLPPNGNVLFAAVENQIVGIGGWTWLPDEHRPERWPDTVAEVRRVFVRKEYRQRGIAKKLNLHIISDAREHGAEYIVAETGDRQLAAILTYRSLGYEATEPFGDLRDNPTSNFFGMRL